MAHPNQTSVLSVGVTDPPHSSVSFVLDAAPTGREAIAMMRVLQFDMLLAGLQIPDMSVWSLVQRVRMGWPGQRWALVAENATPQTEIQARALGALTVFQTTPDRTRLQEFTSAFRGRRPGQDRDSAAETEYRRIVRSAEVGHKPSRCADPSTKRGELNVIR